MTTYQKEIYCNKVKQQLEQKSEVNFGYTIMKNICVFDWYFLGQKKTYHFDIELLNNIGVRYKEVADWILEAVETQA